VQLEWLVQMSDDAQVVLLTSELTMCLFVRRRSRSVGAPKADMHCVLTATWPISDTVAAV